MHIQRGTLGSIVVLAALALSCKSEGSSSYGCAAPTGLRGVSSADLKPRYVLTRAGADPPPSKYGDSAGYTLIVHADTLFLDGGTYREAGLTSLIAPDGTVTMRPHSVGPLPYANNPGNPGSSLLLPLVMGRPATLDFVSNASFTVFTDVEGSQSTGAYRYVWR